MKKLVLTLTFIAAIQISYSQILYDNGAISLSNNFAIMGTWGRNNITFSFQNGTADILNNDEQNAVRQAFQIWADYANITFTEIAQNGDIRILWATGNHGDGAGNAFDGVSPPSIVLAHAFLPDPFDTEPLLGDVHFDDDETWTLDERPIFSGQPIDLVTVAAHEIGHALGLGHSNVTCALMNPIYNGSHRYLSQDDIDGIQTLYGNRTTVRTTGLNCTGGTFFINNLPNGASVNWVPSDLNIATIVNINNQGIVSRAGSASGNVRITGTITLPCGSTVIEFMDIKIGAPNVNFSLQPMYFGQQFCTNSFGNTVSIEPQNLEGVTGIQWGYSSAQNGIPPTIIQGVGSYYQDFTFGVGGSYQIFANPLNNCGIGASIQTLDISVSDNCGGGGWFRITTTPNPAKDDIYVTIDEERQEVKNLSSNENVQMSLYDFNTMQMVRTWRFKNDQKQYKLDARTVKKGMYVLVVTKGKYQQTQKVIVE